MLYEFGEISRNEFEETKSKLMEQLKFVERFKEMNLSARIDIITWENKMYKNHTYEIQEVMSSILNFFKLLEEMETNKIFEKSGNFTCKGPLDSKIESAYHIKINSEKEAEKPDIPASSKLRTKTKSKYRWYS